MCNFCGQNLLKIGRSVESWIQALLKLHCTSACTPPAYMRTPVSGLVSLPEKVAIRFNDSVISCPLNFKTYFTKLPNQKRFRKKKSQLITLHNLHVYKSTHCKNEHSQKHCLTPTGDKDLLSSESVLFTCMIVYCCTIIYFIHKGTTFEIFSIPSFWLLCGLIYKRSESLEFISSRTCDRKHPLLPF